MSLGKVAYPAVETSDQPESLGQTVGRRPRVKFPSRDGRFHHLGLAEALALAQAPKYFIRALVESD